jgi:uncharacterized protein (DUF1330 family)
MGEHQRRSARRNEGVHMPKGYVILTEDIHDHAGMDAYGQASMSSLIEFGGRVLVVDADVELLEGSWHGTRTVIVEYESIERAREWYASSNYRAALPLRLAAADCNVVIASGFELRPSP